jgi:hypothetical protein
MLSVRRVQLLSQIRYTKTNSSLIFLEKILTIYYWSTSGRLHPQQHHHEYLSLELSYELRLKYSNNSSSSNNLKLNKVTSLDSFIKSKHKKQKRSANKWSIRWLHNLIIDNYLMWWRLSLQSSFNVIRCRYTIS